MEQRNAWTHVALILALAWVGSALIAGYCLIVARHGQPTIEVVGSAKKQITSDLAAWTGSFEKQAPSQAQAYAAMKTSEKKVRDYLTAHGVEEKDAVFSALTTTPLFAALPNGQQSNRIEGYKMSQSVEIRSSDLAKVDRLSRSVTDLINDGVEMQSSPPRYFFTKIADLKLEVLSLASQDAKRRADKIAQNAGSRAGRLISAEQGVFQITALYSTEVSDLGVNDTSSVDKEVMAVVICRFEVNQ